MTNHPPPNILASLEQTLEQLVQSMLRFALAYGRALAWTFSPKHVTWHLLYRQPQANGLTPPALTLCISILLLGSVYEFGATHLTYSIKQIFLFLKDHFSTQFSLTSALWSLIPVFGAVVIGNWFMGFLALVPQRQRYRNLLSYISAAQMASIFVMILLQYPIWLLIQHYYPGSMVYRNVVLPTMGGLLGSIVLYLSAMAGCGLYELNGGSGVSLRCVFAAVGSYAVFALTLALVSNLSTLYAVEPSSLHPQGTSTGTQPAARTIVSSGTSSAMWGPL